MLPDGSCIRAKVIRVNAEGYLQEALTNDQSRK
jgi:hypothetical protein